MILSRFRLTRSPGLLFRLRKGSIAFCAAFALLAVITPARANLVVNGSFESTSLTNSGQITTTDLTGWTTSTGTPATSTVPLGFIYFPGTQGNALDDQFGAGNFTMSQGVKKGAQIPNTSPDGGNWIVVDSAPAYQGSISQSITGLKVGSQYALSFYQAAGQQVGFTGPTTEQWKVTFGTQSSLSALQTDPTLAFQPWTKQTMTFTASAVTQLLTFLSQGGPDGAPPFVFLDGVSMVEVVPEPSSLLYMGMGLSCLIVSWRLRNRGA
jgi:hypothetical protein